MCVLLTAFLLHIYEREGDSMNINELAEKYENIRNKRNRHSAIQITDYGNMFIECCREVLVFNENMICLKLARCSVTIIGLNLKMRNYSSGGADVNGIFHSITFEPLNERTGKHK